MRENIKGFFKEIIPITVGILIALYINNWNENRKDQNYVDKITSSIKLELEESNEDITFNIEVQKAFIDTLNLYLENDKVSILDITIKGNGINIPSIKINAWKAISNSKIELMEYEKITMMANIEAQKAILNSKSERLANFIYANLKESDKDNKELLRLQMQDIIGTEITLKKIIDVVLDKLKMPTSFSKN